MNLQSISENWALLIIGGLIAWICSFILKQISINNKNRNDINESFKKYRELSACVVKLKKVINKQRKKNQTTC
jgi:hypothetical protein